MVNTVQKITPAALVSPTTISNLLQLHYRIVCKNTFYKAKYPAIYSQNIQRTFFSIQSSKTVIFSKGSTKALKRISLIDYLLYAIGDYIPEVLFDCAVDLQPQQNKDSEVIYITSADAGLYQHLIDFLSERQNLKRNLEEFVSYSSENKTQTDIYKMAPDNRAYWIYRALKLCCYIFPQDQILEPL